jgi:hypothetical protein
MTREELETIPLLCRPWNWRDISLANWEKKAADVLNKAFDNDPKYQAFLEKERKNTLALRKILDAGLSAAADEVYYGGDKK